MTLPHGSGPGKNSTYFFLSYERSAPLPEDRSEGTTAPPVGVVDVAVKGFFEDLNAKVAEHARHETPGPLGFLDQNLPTGADLKTRLTAALSGTQVFVALHSPGYLAKSWTRKELRAYRQRLDEASLPDAERHIVQVLWTPLPPFTYPPEVTRMTESALRFGESIPGYAENGVRALSLLGTYRDTYRHVVDLLGRRIVDVAESEPLEWTRAPSFDDVDGEVTDPSFVVAVLTSGDGRGGPPGRTRAGLEWSPFTTGPLPVAHYAQSTAERLGLTTSKCALRELAGLTRRAPGIVLVDPWILDGPASASLLLDAFQGVPPWVLPVVVVDGEAPRFRTKGHRLLNKAFKQLQDTGRTPVGRADELSQFISALPAAISQARRAFLKQRHTAASLGATSAEKPGTAGRAATIQDSGGSPDE